MPHVEPSAALHDRIRRQIAEARAPAVRTRHRVIAALGVSIALFLIIEAVREVSIRSSKLQRTDAPSIVYDDYDECDSAEAALLFTPGWCRTSTGRQRA